MLPGQPSKRTLRECTIESFAAFVQQEESKRKTDRQEPILDTDPSREEGLIEEWDTVEPDGKFSLEYSREI